MQNRSARPHWELRIVIGALLCCNLSCTKTILEVEYPQMTSSAEPYAELSKLAIGLDNKLDAAQRAEILTRLKTCPLFTEVALMDKPVRVSGSNPKDYFDALIKRSQQAQTSQGILSIQVEDLSESSQLEKSQALLITDQTSNDWHPAYGIPILDSLGLPAHPEVAPNRSFKKREAYIRADKIQYLVRFVMYNRVAGKIIHDRIVTNNSVLYNYSRKSSLKRQKFSDLVQKAVIDEILFYACPAKETVNRRLYYQNSLDPNAEQVNEGVDLVDENRWNLAATKWANVLLKDKKNIHAHHNLGVHMERSGELFQAMEHFRQARKGAATQGIPDKVFEEVRAKYQPHLSGAALYPQVAFVTGGNWVFVRSDDIEINEALTYSVYRFETLMNSDGSRPTGLAIREIGVVKLVNPSDQFYLARLKEHLIDFPVRPGDFIVPE